MKFIIKHNIVRCVREIEGAEHLIAQFDSQLNTVAPHVEAVLSNEEIAELKTWLSEKEMVEQQLDDQSTEETLIETVPLLLLQVAEALDNVSDIDKNLKEDIRDELSQLNKKLDALKEVDSGTVLTEQVNIINDSELLKLQLNTIQEDLSSGTNDKEP